MWFLALPALMMGLGYQWHLAKLWHAWNQEVTQQLALDHCAESAAIGLRSQLQRMDWVGDQMRALRWELTSTLLPGLAAAKHAALLALATTQRVTDAQIALQRYRWAIPRCGEYTVIPRGFASPYRVPTPPRDVLGPRPYDIDDTPEIQIELESLDRAPHTGRRLHSHAWLTRVGRWKASFKKGT